VRLTELQQNLLALRTSLAEELHAISRLEGQMASLTDDAAQEELRRIADDKKGHAAALLRQIARLDPKFGERLGL
jgi:hypothetical protein